MITLFSVVVLIFKKILILTGFLKNQSILSHGSISKIFALWEFAQAYETSKIGRIWIKSRYLERKKYGEQEMNLTNIASFLVHYDTETQDRTPIQLYKSSKEIDGTGAEVR